MTDNNWQFSPEQMDKIRNCTSSEELVELANSEGVELNDNQLEAISGGDWFNCSDEEGYCWNKTW